MARSLYGPLPDKGPLSPSDLYIGLMEEVKLRGAVMETYFKGQPEISHPQFALEFCFLQLRMIFEIIAIGCLVLHKNTTDMKSFEKLWHADHIMDRLERLNVNFFPKATRILRTPDTNFVCHDLDPQPLNKKDFLTLYGKCGAQLHRGTLKEISGVPLLNVDFSEAQQFLHKIVDQLREHRIASPDYKIHYFVKMENGSPGSGAAMLTSSV